MKNNYSIFAYYSTPKRGGPTIFKGIKHSENAKTLHSIFNYKNVNDLTYLESFWGGGEGEGGFADFLIVPSLYRMYVDLVKCTYCVRI